MRFLLFFFLIIGYTSCTNQEAPSFLDTPKMDFIHAVNQENSIDHFYWRQGALFWNHHLYKNRDSIAKYIASLSKIERFESLKIIRHDSLGYFETGFYYTKDSLDQEQSIAYLIAWKNEAGTWLKELEILTPKTIHRSIPLKDIDQARQDWEKCSNAQDHSLLVDSMYCINSFYFNDGYIYKGRTPIREKYQYMSKEQWHIKLATIKTMQVNDSLFYDVGQYQSSGRGHYCILWQLQEEGNWQVLLDFNF